MLDSSKKIKEIEEQFSDELAKKLELEYKANDNLPITRDIFIRCAIDSLGDVRGKFLLDLGCGIGEISYFLAKKGSAVVGIDISRGMLNLSSKRIRDNKFEEKANFLKMTTEKVGFKDNSFDAVFGGYILHHTEVELTIKEVYRVLKKGGKATFVENFANNKILIFSRRYLAGRFGIPRYGTITEHPLTNKDIKIIKSLFKKVKIINPDMNFLQLLDRQIFKYRYPFISRFCEYFDRWLFYAFPELRKLSYTQVIVVEK
ncbi:class I SAM-dependent methyltransferase [candidate division WOR-3 bacterium]|nr:class I SAM-dependent methyltransferase [candidate division WOR-3 bacterium]